MSYIPWFKRMEPITLGERFELDQFSTRAKPLSPTKSYAEKPTYNWEEGDWWDLDDQSVGNTKILEDFEITDEMRRRPNAAGGRIALSAGTVAQVPNYIQTARKVYNVGKKIFNSFKNIRRTHNLKDAEVNAVRSAINTEVKKDLGPMLSVSKVSKSGDVIYQLAKTGEPSTYSKDLAPLILERNTFIADKIKPLADKGFGSAKDFTKLLTDANISTVSKTDRGLSQQVSKIADTYGVEKVESPFGGKSFWYKLPNKEKLAEIQRLRLKPVERVPIAKKFIKDLNLTSHTQLNKVMKNKGYNMFKVEELNKFFPEIKNYAWTDPRWVPPGKTYTPTSVLNSAKYHLKKKMSGLKTEGFVVGAKKVTGKGKDVHLMHTTQKGKKTGLLNWDDLVFGSAKENEAYAKGLDDVRSGFTTILENIANKHGGKNLEVVVETASSLRKNYGFPNKMKLKDYIERINKGLVELAAQTNGKVRGDILSVKGNNLKFIENKIGIDYSMVPGKGILKGNIKKYENLFKKIKMDAKGNIILDTNGMPAVKKGYTLSQKEAEDVLSVWLNIPSQMKPALKTKPFKGKLEFAEGGRTGFEEGTQPSKLKKVGSKIMTGAEKVLRPLFVPTVDAAIGLKDPSDPFFWMSKAFWAHAMDKYGITRTYDMLKKTPDFKGKAKILRDMSLRLGVLSPNVVRGISRVSWPLTAYASVAKWRAEPFMKTSKKAEELGIDVSQYVDRTGGVIDFTDELYEEIAKRESGQGMDYATGGIASLIK